MCLFLPTDLFLPTEVGALAGTRTKAAAVASPDPEVSTRLLRKRSLSRSEVESETRFLLYYLDFFSSMCRTRREQLYILWYIFSSIYYSNVLMSWSKKTYRRQTNFHWTRDLPRLFIWLPSQQRARLVSRPLQSAQLAA